MRVYLCVDCARVLVYVRICVLTVHVYLCDDCACVC